MTFQAHTTMVCCYLIANLFQLSFCNTVLLWNEKS